MKEIKIIIICDIFQRKSAQQGQVIHIGSDSKSYSKPGTSATKQVL